MDDLDSFIESYPLHAAALGAFIKATMPVQERLDLARALGREPDYKDCLRYTYEKIKHEDFLRDQGRQELQRQELNNKEAIHRLIWGHGT